jgi:hypothetical protein
MYSLWEIRVREFQVFVCAGFGCCVSWLVMEVMYAFRKGR